MTIQHTTSSDSSVATLSTIQPAHRPLLASIGTVLIDSFESPPRPNLDISNVQAPQAPSVPQPRAVISSNDPAPPIPTTLPTSGPSTRPPSSRPSTSSSTSSAVRKRLSDVSGRSTPQRNFNSPAPSPTDDVWEILGGGAMYALVGARMWLDSSDLRCVVDRSPEERGRDFPKKLEDQLNVFGEDIWCWNEGPETRTTKSRLKYVDGVRYFGYINEPPRRSVQSLVDTPVFGSEYLHVSPPYTPEEVITILDDLRTIKNGAGETWNPKVIYEPHPLYCEASQRPILERAVPLIDILSPNHEELLAIYDQPCTVSTYQQLQEVISPVICHLLDVVGVGRNGRGAVVVRCGRHGSCVGTKSKGIKWFPAYFTEKDSGRVIDVSGAGNSYLGGYAAGLLLSGGDPYEAALYATVSSSFVVEQIGLPRLDSSSGWNGEDPLKRLEILRNRIAGTISRSELDEMKM